MASQAFAWNQGLCGQANLVCNSSVGLSAAQRSELNTGEVTAAYTVGTPWGCTQAPSGPQTQSGARPQAEALSSTLSASRSRSAWAAAPHLQVPQEASGGFRAASWEKSVCSSESSGPRQEPLGACFLIQISLSSNTTSPGPERGSAGGKLCTRGHLGRGSLHW